MARNDLAVTSKTLTSPFITRPLFLKRRRGSAELGCYNLKRRCSPKTIRLLPLKTPTVTQLSFLYVNVGGIKIWHNNYHSTIFKFLSFYLVSEHPYLLYRHASSIYALFLLKPDLLPFVSCSALHTWWVFNQSRCWFVSCLWEVYMVGSVFFVLE